MSIDDFFKHCKPFTEFSIPNESKLEFTSGINSSNPSKLNVNLLEPSPYFEIGLVKSFNMIPTLLNNDCDICVDICLTTHTCNSCNQKGHNYVINNCSKKCILCKTCNKEAKCWSCLKDELHCDENMDDWDF